MGKINSSTKNGAANGGGGGGNSCPRWKRETKFWFEWQTNGRHKQSEWCCYQIRWTGWGAQTKTSLAFVSVQRRRSATNIVHSSTIVLSNWTRSKDMRFARWSSIVFETTCGVAVSTGAIHQRRWNEIETSSTVRVGYGIGQRYFCQ